MKLSQLNKNYANESNKFDPNNRRHDDTLNEYSPKQIKMAFGILNDPRYRDGNYDGAYAAIEKLAKGLASHPNVANALKRANESFEQKISPYFIKEATGKCKYCGCSIDSPDPSCDCKYDSHDASGSNWVNEGIYAKNKEDPMNPEVLIQGYGRLMLKQLESKVSSMFTELAEMCDKGNWSNVEYNLNKGLVQEFLKTITETYEELEQIRKRGGMNSRGIKQR